MPGWLALLLSWPFWALVALLLGAVALLLSRAPPPSEKTQVQGEELEKKRPADVSEIEATRGNGARRLAPDFMGNGATEMEKETVEAEKERVRDEKPGSEEQPTLEEKEIMAEPPQKTPSKEPPEDFWSVQVAAFRDNNDAKRLADRLKAKGYDAYIASYAGWHQVRVGRLPSRKEAGRLRESLAGDEGLSRAFLTEG